MIAMTTAEQIAWIGKFQYWFQGQEEHNALEQVKESLRRLGKLEESMRDTETQAQGDSKEETPKSQYKDFIAAYHSFCTTYIGVGPKLDGVQGKAMKQIIAYLVQESKGKDEDGALAAWSYILSNWGMLTEFLQKQTALVQINKNLQEILTQLRHAKSANTSAADAVKRRVAGRK
jgi:hypothetical protein